MKRSTLRWFGHIERLENEEFVKEVYRSSVEGPNRRGRPLGRWEDRVKECVSERIHRILTVIGLLHEGHEGVVAAADEDFVGVERHEISIATVQRYHAFLVAGHLQGKAGVNSLTELYINLWS